MDDKKAYKEALERAKKIRVESPEWWRENEGAMCEIFPELKESEDERIRKIITDSVFYHHGAGVEYKDVLDYLDKLENLKEQKADNDRYMEGYMRGIGEQKPAEWSEEDKQCIDEAIEILENLGYDGEADNLKNLRPQPHWKPSEEQMNALERAIIKMHTPTDIGILAELRDNLKKL